MDFFLGVQLHFTIDLFLFLSKTLFFVNIFLILRSNILGGYIGRDLVSAILLALIHEGVRSFEQSFQCVLRP